MHPVAPQQTLEALPALVWRADLQGKCIYVNVAWTAFTGGRADQEMGDGWMARVHPDDLAGCRQVFELNRHSGRAFQRQFRLRRFDGAYRRVVDKVAPLTEADGRPSGYVGICLDLDEIVDHESPVAGLNEFFEMSLDNVCVAGLDGYFKHVNPSWTRTLGWKAEELLSKPSIEFVHPDDRAATLAGRERLRAGAALGPLVNRYLCKDGSFRWLEWRSVADRERQLVYAVARDITEQKQAEHDIAVARHSEERMRRQLIFADRMASVGTLAAGVAHEINNPLAYVASNISLIREELENLTPPLRAEVLSDLKDMAREAQLGAERIRKIVRGLKTFSRTEEERRTAIDVVALLELSINMTFSEIRHRTRLVKDFGNIPPVYADDARLGQVFINLLVNAAQAIPEGHSDANEIRVTTGTDGEGRAVIDVADTGAGVPAHLIDRIFEPFFTTKEVGVGTGLGLSICHNIVSSLGGTIAVMPGQTRGTQFRVVLPPAIVESAGADEGAASTRLPLSCASVLVIDDEPAIGLVLKRTLREHEVTVVTSAPAALALLAAGRSFDVILCDIMMPQMSGMEFYAELSQRFAHLAPRVVFVSGGAFTPAAHAFMDKVPNERIEKPFDPKAVRELVQRVLREGPLGAASL